MNTSSAPSTETKKTTLSRDTRSIPMQPGRQRSALPINRKASLTAVEGIEDIVRPGPWKSRVANLLLACAVLWFLVQSVLLRLIEVVPTPVTSAHVAGEVVQPEGAGIPLAHIPAELNYLASGATPLEVAAFPLVWVVLFALLLGLFLLTERRHAGLANKVLGDLPPERRAEQQRFFGRAGLGPEGTSAAAVVDEDGDHFADDLPSHLRKHLSWWRDETAPEQRSLTEALAELKKFLGDEAYLWFRACAIWPFPQWHLALYLGRGLRNSHGESLHSFETADRLASLPWFMTGTMPMWLRRHLLGTLSKEQQQEVRYLIQALLISTARGTKADFALELAEYHTLFMKSTGNDATLAILKELPADSPLRDSLFLQFMEKPLDSAFYKTLKSRNEDDTAKGADYARVSERTKWVGRLLWSACAAVLVASLVLLPILASYGGVRISTRHLQGVVEVNEAKKAPPATYYWLRPGEQQIVVTSKDFESVRLRVNVKGRTITDLGALVMKHERTGFSNPQPGDLP